jgi:hypothetical protein
MTGEVIAFKDLRVAPQGEVMDFTFYNKRFLEIVSAINELALRQDGYDNTSNQLIALGLQRINDTLGPFLTSLQDAAHLGFLVCEATGLPVNFTVGVDVQLIVNSAGKSVFTPTPWLLALDENDYTNWAILSFTSYSPTTGVLACGCVYTTQHKTSARWSISCNSAMLAAETNLLTQAQTAANQAAANAAAVQTLTTQVQQLIQIVQAGPVISVAGRSGVVVLGMADVSGLTDALLQKAAVSDLTSGLSGKQPVSALLTTFAALAGAADKFPYFTGVGAMALATVTAFARTLLVAPDAATTRTTLGLGDVVTHAASEFATPASVATQVVPIIQSTPISTRALSPVFDDQTVTSYALVDTHWGSTVTFTNAAAITATLSSNIPKGWQVLVYQGGAGQVTFAPAAGVTLRNRQNQFKTAGQYAMVSLMCMSNPTGTAPTIVLGGDTA